MEKLLEIKDLNVHFDTDAGLSRAVEGVCLDIKKGETVGVVGESGCGKTVTALSILRLIPSPVGKIVSGEIIFKGKDLLKLQESELRDIRGKLISMIFQEPTSALNPVYTIGYQIAESMKIHLSLDKYEIRKRTIKLLTDVEMPTPEQQIDNYPHQLSGGMCQRAIIAMALSCNPELLIADEPTTALDVTIQAQILNLFSKLKEKLGISILLITHDLAVVSEVADRVVVMYAGMTVESSLTEELFTSPLHPYTQGLISSVPMLCLDSKSEKLSVIPGNVPDPVYKPVGCPFHPRCNMAGEKCKKETPALIEVKSNHWVRCWKIK